MSVPAMVPTVVETLPFGVSRTSARMAEITPSEFMGKVLALMRHFSERAMTLWD